VVEATQLPLVHVTSENRHRTSMKCVTPSAPSHELIGQRGRQDITAEALVEHGKNITAAVASPASALESRNTSIDTRTRVDNLCNHSHSEEAPSL
jgi:hypothetical protein